MTDAALADRFDAIELVRWRDDEAFRLLLVTLAAILPLRNPSPLAEDLFRARLLELRADTAPLAVLSVIAAELER